MDHPRNRLAPLRNDSKLRRETFQNGWPPEKNFLSIDTFVNQGFYFLGTGNDDRVQCVYCAGVLGNWHQGDDIETEHRRNFPQCPLMKLPMKCPAYKDLSTRKLSFQGWPPQMTQKPDDLAEAGLFYLGQGDKTKCFWCSGVLSEWEANDVPIVEHVRFFPQCQWLIASKGKEFVDRVRQHLQQGAPVSAMVLIDSSNSLLPSQALPTESSLSAHAASPVPSAHLEALNMGFDQLTIDEAIQNLGTRDINVESLIRAILDIQAGQASGSSSNNIDIRSLAQENQQLKAKTICKICGQRPVGLVFIPCGHIVTCVECGQRLTQCPICFVQIDNSFSAYM